MFLLLTQIALAECTNPLPTAMFSNELDEIEAGVLQQSLTQMSQSMYDIEKQLPCIVQVITPELAARYHLLSGIKFWIFRDETTAKLYFAAAKHADSSISIPTKVFPTEHQLHTTLEETPELAETSATPPQDHIIYFDGEASWERPQYRPSIVQYSSKDDTNAIVLTQLLMPNSSLPPHPQQKSLPTSSLPPPPTAPVSTPAPPKWSAAQTASFTLGAVLCTGGSLLWANSSAKKHSLLYTETLKDPNSEPSDLLLSRANSLLKQNRIGWSGAGLCGAATLSLGALMYGQTKD